MFISNHAEINQEKCVSILGKRLRNIVDKSFEIDVDILENSANKRQKILDIDTEKNFFDKNNHDSTAELINEARNKEKVDQEDDADISSW